MFFQVTLFFPLRSSRGKLPSLAVIVWISRSRRELKFKQERKRIGQRENRTWNKRIC
ncbi:hypothetical protein LEP1GSC089_1618 [Leptospira interrogans serovar Autumnalis str. LP101]|nr:hypothetical protein LEP1GSC089_1618 [Leptospira interrogans serovar Autumnalis str. LP101]EMN82248.1 hypothetical protein LEP1GSC106_3705 [Leptospira interrogans serovar Grippotyphosa str. UI 12764]